MSANTVIHPVQGVYAGTTCAKIKKSGKEDFVLFQFNDAAVTVATFTLNAFCAAPVTLAKRHLAVKAPKALVINSGNANAGTGKQGMMDAEQTCAWVAKELGCSEDEVLPFSTGVIGQNLPMDKVQQAIPMAAANLKIDGWDGAMKGIMTTDTVEKIYSEKVSIGGHEVTFTGIAKGSGMIHPNMATMLGFVATDAKITKACLQQAMTDATNLSFNRITVDGDTSTNDACTLTATQQADMPTIEDCNSMAYQEFANALNHCMMTLAQKIVRDGEGATKFVAVEVENARTSEEALKVAHAVALSPLVKTALFASDPNWGRILAAVGRAGVEDFDIDAIQIYLGNVLLVENGGRADSYTEEAGQAVMNETDITIKIILNRGEAGEVVWTTDFSYEYVKINAEYRT
ncbi:MAG: bifunctional glutamate N-acetyltransferase/amino-acid acetyltransferase ArgJ [Thiotrichales bacterium]|nr:bifunctional glutamate N-acetyltransferase/amino-acid acetyltransferase ArgJ [Thiotrichales bacterium]